MNSALATRVTVEAAYVYFDYIGTRSEREGWREQLYADITNGISENEASYAALLGRIPTAEDAPFLRELTAEIAAYVTGNMLEPKEKIDNYKPIVLLLLDAVFSVRCYLVLMCIAAIMAVLYGFMSFDKAKIIRCVCSGLLIGGILCLVLTLLCDKIPQTLSTLAESIKTMLIIVGLCYCAAAIIALVVKKFIKVKRRHNSEKLMDTPIGDTGFTNRDLAVMSTFNMTDLMLKNKERPKGPVDYYGDWRAFGGKNPNEKADEDNSQGEQK